MMWGVKGLVLLLASLVTVAQAALPVLPALRLDPASSNVLPGEAFFAVQDLQRTAPHLVRVDPSDDDTAWLSFPGSGQSLVMGLEGPHLQRMFSASSLLHALSSTTASGRPVHTWTLHGWPNPVLSTGTYRVQLGQKGAPASPTHLYEIYARQVCGSQRGVSAGNVGYTAEYRPETGDIAPKRGVGGYRHSVTLKGRPHQVFMAVTTTIHGGRFGAVTHTDARGRAQIIVPHRNVRFQYSSASPMSRKVTRTADQAEGRYFVTLLQLSASLGQASSTCRGVRPDQLTSTGKPW